MNSVEKIGSETGTFAILRRNPDLYQQKNLVIFGGLEASPSLLVGWVRIRYELRIAVLKPQKDAN